MRGVLDFAVFEECTGSEEEILSAIGEGLPAKRSFDADALRALGSRRIRERVFFGDWYDHETGNLIKVGGFRTASGEELENPVLKKLDRVTITSSASPAPDTRRGGQFAYAFSNAPYGLHGRPSDVQADFEEIRDYILPPAHACEIRDWSSAELGGVSDYFEAGLEWWGVFLFSIHVPALQRLTVIAGSTTD
jgi:hypothetical protein